jgi:hypothetical protein
LEKGEINRFWRMDCRLETFCSILIAEIGSHCVSLFRRIYFDIFRDNIYRPDYMNKAVILSQDGEQLFQNIITLSYRKTFYDMIKDLVIQHCTLKATKHDKFNLQADDKLQKNTYSKIVDDEEELYSFIEKLFDNIEKKDIDELLKHKK